ncbi:hypothetical protein E2C01_097529 [Portunus trituberculatus]|uniref:Uncharacterized protein n=1 Tax=Portunus trituberculatus TaxID=210409 RepID=A0A5B7K523_PORTR|nr:hypothetical protein [Portunus trituberculatus]
MDSDSDRSRNQELSRLMFELHARFLKSDGEWKYLASFSTCSVATSSEYLGVTKLFSHFEGDTWQPQRPAVSKAP